MKSDDLREANQYTDDVLKRHERNGIMLGPFLFLLNYLLTVLTVLLMDGKF